MVTTRSEMETRMDAMEQKMGGMENMLARVLTMVEELNSERKLKKVAESEVDDPGGSAKKVTKEHSDDEGETKYRSRPRWLRRWLQRGATEVRHTRFQR